MFAGAIEWPGLARAARTEADALGVLFGYVPRYKRSLGRVARDLKLPRSVSDLDVVARLEGGSGTDFGVPSAIGSFDREALVEADLASAVEPLRRAWAAFERAAVSAAGKTLATGPRGGGRALTKMRAHVTEADAAYISSLGAKPPRGSTSWDEIQAAFVEALGAKVRGELPEVGPRGGERWPARYAIRRSAWHALDHAWEIEDRLAG